MSEKGESLIPNWVTAARIYITALEDGTYEGKRAAREGILEMGSTVDELNRRVKLLATELRKTMSADEVEELLEKRQ